MYMFDYLIRSNIISEIGFDNKSKKITKSKPLGSKNIMMQHDYKEICKRITCVFFLIHTRHPRNST